MIDAALSKNSDRLEIFSTQDIAELNKQIDQTKCLAYL
ncbi:MAG: hypothetical protein CM15mP122_1820 [Bacteroidota bacterium]|nr:MAG: hypothetical protein CM15mP122_1820 [Bacteroidota bacterium]